MTRRLRPLAKLFLALFAWATAGVWGVLARTGIGTAAAVRRGFVAVPLHYYQPVFNPSAIPDEVWAREHDLPAVSFRPEGQLEFLTRISAFAEECVWPETLRRGEPLSYYSRNPSFGYASACLLHSVVRHVRPARVVEVGAGMSTLVLRSALASNRSEGAAGGLLTIDPFPPAYVRELPDSDHELIECPVEQLDPAQLCALGRNDLLFIDSSHVSRTGGDVNFLYLDVLPRLVGGAIVHIHDIYLPFEYPRIYSSFQNGPPRYYWNEQYLLQAFLAGNPTASVLLAAWFLDREFRAEVNRHFPGIHAGGHRPSTSFYVALEPQPGH